MKQDEEPKSKSRRESKAGLSVAGKRAEAKTAKLPNPKNQSQASRDQNPN